MIFGFAFFRLNAMAKEIGPTRPKYMVAIIINLPNVFKEPVRFLVRPTVAVALTVSYRMSSVGALEATESNTVEQSIMVNDINTTAIALSMDCFAIVRLNMVT